MGSRRSGDKTAPTRSSRIVKPKAALQNVSGRKVVNKKFEEKYEMFKKKWKEDKEKRRKMQSEDMREVDLSPAVSPVFEKNTQHLDLNMDERDEADVAKKAATVDDGEVSS